MTFACGGIEQYPSKMPASKSSYSASNVRYYPSTAEPRFCRYASADLHKPGPALNLLAWPYISYSATAHRADQFRSSGAVIKWQGEL